MRYLTTLSGAEIILRQFRWSDKEPKYSDTAYPCATFCTTHPTCTGQGLNPGVCGDMPAANHQSHGFIRTCCSKGNAQVFATPEHHEVRTNQPARQDHYGKHYSAVWTCSTKRITRLRKQKSPATATAVSALLLDLPLSSFNIMRLDVHGHMFLRAKHGRRKHIRGDSTYEP